MTLWRRLRRLGAVSPAGGVYVLPAQASCVEAFQWLAQEILQTAGQALVMHVHQFDGITDQQLMALFQSARRAEYQKLEPDINTLSLQIKKELDEEQKNIVKDALGKLQLQYKEINQIDYFKCPVGIQVSTKSLRPLPGLGRLCCAGTIHCGGIKGRLSE